MTIMSELCWEVKMWIPWATTNTTLWMEHYDSKLRFLFTKSTTLQAHLAHKWPEQVLRCLEKDSLGDPLEWRANNLESEQTTQRCLTMKPTTSMMLDHRFHTRMFRTYHHSIVHPNLSYLFSNSKINYMVKGLFIKHLLNKLLSLQASFKVVELAQNSGEGSNW